MKKLLSILMFALICVLGVATIQPTYAATSYISIDQPDDFDWNGPTVNVFKNSEGYYTNLDITDYKVNTLGTVGYVAKTGNDSTGDGSESTPYLTINKAITEGFETIYVDSGWYIWSEGMAGVTQDNVEINIIGQEDDVYITAFRDTSDYAFALTDTRTYTYEHAMTTTSVQQVFDKSLTDVYDGYYKLTEVESVDLVEATKGSYYISGTKIYVHTYDERVPDSDIIIDLTARPMQFTNSTVYLENLHIYGGITTLQADDSNVYCKDVEVAYSQIAGVKMISSDSIFQDVISNHNMGDGFAYSNGDATVNPWAIEIDVTGYANGVYESDNIYNGSSLHQNYTAIRINGEYSYNKGPQVHDIDSSQSVNYGSYAHHSLSSEPLRDSNFRIDETTLSNLMWLYDVESSSSAYDFQASNTEVTVENQDDYQMFIGSYTLDEDTTTPVTGSTTPVAPAETLEWLGIAWYWWVVIGVAAYYFLGTKKGRKILGLK